MKTEMVKISEIKIGDSVKCKDGFTRTVTSQNFTKCNFMGLCIFGDSYMCGHENVERVIILRSTRNGIVRES